MRDRLERFAGCGRDLRAACGAGKGKMARMGKRSEKSGPRGGGLGTREDAVRGCASDRRLEDFGTEEGAVSEDMVRGWGGGL
jgi:hypothetical protein